jgi:3-oxoacyl-[acyl-carrier-protein] synthase-3
VIGSANGTPISITGLGGNVPERVMTNEELATRVETSDEWIVERTGIRERRIADDAEVLTDVALPAARRALIVATVTPDMPCPASAALLADRLGMADAAAYDLSAGCTGFMYAIAQAYGMLAGGLARRALVVGGDVLSKIVDWSDRTTCVLFGDGAGAVVLERVDDGGFLGFELGAEGAGGVYLSQRAGGFVEMNGREVYKFATRVLVASAQKILTECGRTIEDVDVYVPHQANVRIIEYATSKLGIDPERAVINVDRYGNTSSGSIPLALVDAQRDGRLSPGKLVLMTGMGAGLTWGSSLIEWTEEMAA